ncbi:MAG: hypothetical protein Q9166_000702 [cf. Caloplaca sp. 2 TL-2023]
MTKGKSSEEKALSRIKPRKRVAFSAPNAHTKATYIRSYPFEIQDLNDCACGSIAQNALASPLLRLPPELRNRIWAEILGERLIHLKHLYYDRERDFEENDDMYFSTRRYGNGSAWRRVICEDDGPEDQSDRKIDIGQVEKEKVY